MIFTLILEIVHRDILLENSIQCKMLLESSPAILRLGSLYLSVGGRRGRLSLFVEAGKKNFCQEYSAKGEVKEIQRFQGRGKDSNRASVSHREITNCAARDIHLYEG
jgi:hypothetical protein